jgi:hypothetical protein
LAKTMMLYLLATFDITFNSEPIPVLPFWLVTNKTYGFYQHSNYNVQWSPTDTKTGNSMFSLMQQPKLGIRCPNVQVSGSHTIRHTHTHTQGRTTLNVWSAGLRGRYIYKIHSAQKTKVHASSWIRSCDPSNRTAADLSLRQHDHPDRRTRQHATKIFKATNKHRKFDWQNGHNCLVTSGSDGVYQRWFTHRKPWVQTPKP